MLSHNEREAERRKGGRAREAIGKMLYLDFYIIVGFLKAIYKLRTL